MVLIVRQPLLVCKADCLAARHCSLEYGYCISASNLAAAFSRHPTTSQLRLRRRFSVQATGGRGLAYTASGRMQPSAYPHYKLLCTYDEQEGATWRAGPRTCGRGARG